MTVAPVESELRPAYRTLNDPTRLLGLPIAALAGLVVAGLIGYALLRVSPLPWKVNASVVIVCVGAPAAVLALRDATTIGPGRMLAGVLAWRLRPTRVAGVLEHEPLKRGGVRLDRAVADAAADVVVDVDELPWTARPDALDAADSPSPCGVDAASPEAS